MDTWLTRESKSVEASHSSRAALNKLNSIKARLRNARSEVYCTLQVSYSIYALFTTFSAASCLMHADSLTLWLSERLPVLAHQEQQVLVVCAQRPGSWVGVISFEAKPSMVT